MDNGKTNTHGRIEYGGCMRSKTVLECPHNALAIYLFERIHVDKEPFPTFKRREDWYPIHLLRHTDRTSPLQYWSHYVTMRDIQHELGIHTSKKTHLNRGGAARHAEDSGASEGEIRRAGRWNVQEMQGCYLTGLPRKAMRALAGFPTKPGSYFLPRATINPPPALLAMIWPGVETAQIGIETGAYEKDLAAQGFLRLLVYLRIVLIQDAVVMRKLYPSLPFLQHSIFSTPIFLSFAKDLETALELNERPLSVSVNEVLPEIHQYLTDMRRDQQAAHLITQHTSNNMMHLAGLVQGAFTQLSHQIQTLSNQEIKVTVHVEQQRSLPVAVAATTTSSSSSTPLSTLPWTPPSSSLSFLQQQQQSASYLGARLPLPASSSAVSVSAAATAAALACARPISPSPSIGSVEEPSASASTVSRGPMLALPAPPAPVLPATPSPDYSSALPSHRGPPSGSGSSAGASAFPPASASLSLSPPPAFALPVFSAPSTPSLSLQSSEPEKYEQSRIITTITHVWEEYSKGINGGPAVRDLETRWQHKWRADVKNRKFFSQRSKLYSIIQRLAAEKRISEDAAATALESARAALKKSVDWCQKHTDILYTATLSCLVS
ncbi:hypothetical protein A4X13_0g385 [Tilletia indica]|uniref:Transcription activator GCR1-like domain-containing protein n=1 Tax=Tilletia indica TaxID=43049 RepID=A0A177TS90_9BASI|nr:hypothetical protein A4X13_0g387 [Tilletia indica]KAE8260368.1 hypothetical protein A4X13_0g385 [Tilletia indica]